MPKYRRQGRRYGKCGSGDMIRGGSFSFVRKLIFVRAFAGTSQFFLCFVRLIRLGVASDGVIKLRRAKVTNPFA